MFLRVSGNLIERGQGHTLEPEIPRVAQQGITLAGLLQRIGQKQVGQPIAIVIAHRGGITHREHPFRHMGDARVHAGQRVAHGPAGRNAGGENKPGFGRQHLGKKHLGIGRPTQAADDTQHRQPFHPYHWRTQARPSGFPNRYDVQTRPARGTGEKERVKQRRQRRSQMQEQIQHRHRDAPGDLCPRLSRRGHRIGDHVEGEQEKRRGGQSAFDQRAGRQMPSHQPGP